MDTFLSDVRYALRRLGRDRAFAAAAILTVALVIGLNTAIFSVTNAVLLRPLPYTDPDRLVLVGKAPQGDTQPWGLSEPEYFDYVERERVFEGMAASEPVDLDLVSGPIPEPLAVERISASLVPLLGVKPILGRAFAPDEQVSGHDRVAMLSEGLWRRAFNADPHIVGKRIRLKGYAEASVCEVVGVMPASFRLRYRTTAGSFQSRPDKGIDLFVPLVPSGIRGNHGLRKTGSWTVYARLARGVSLDQARAATELLQTHLKKEFPASIQEWTSVLQPIHEATFGSTRTPVLLLTGAVALVLLVGCTNIANLLLARGAARGHEMSVRAALGSGRWRLFRQLLTEHLVLAAIGGVLGSSLAVALTGIAARVVPSEFARGDDIPIDLSVLGYSAAVTLVAGLLFGLLPAWRASRPGAEDGLRVGAATPDRASGRFAHLLIGAQVCLVLVLCACAALLVGSFSKLVRTDLGFDMDHVITFMLRVPNDMGQDFPRRVAFDEQLLARVRLIPGVREATTTSDLPFSSGGLTGFTLPNEPRPHWAEVLTIEPGYLSLVRLRVVGGRTLVAADQRGRRVALINQAAAEKYFRGRNPIGERLFLRDDYEIVGVVANHGELVGRNAGVRASFLREDDDTQAVRRLTPPAVYVPSAQAPWNAWLLYLVVRTGPNPQSVVTATRREIAELEPGLAVKDVATFADWMAMSTAGTRFYAAVLALFAIVALVLAAVGIYGVLAQSVARRVPEIGVRLALGASAGRVVRLVLGQTLGVVFAGLLAGLVGTWMATRLIASFLFDVSPTDAGILAVVVVLLVAVAAAATWIPARRATGIDPMEALRCE